MSWAFFIVLFAVVIRSGFGLDCTQIPSSSVLAGNTVHLPGPSDQLQIIPARFNCLYKISAPGNSTHGLSASVLIQNGMRGSNDYIKVVDITGYENVFNNRTRFNETYHVIPGAEMTVQVVTRSVYMQSMFEVTVEYQSAQIGPTYPMKTGAEMNYIDIHMTYALEAAGNNYDWYAIDGTIDNQTQIIGGRQVVQEYTTKSNAFTILSFSDDFLGFVFNPKSEAEKFTHLLSVAVGDSLEDNRGGLGSFDGKPGAVQVVNFERNGIIMDGYHLYDDNCTVYVVSGAPNNSSKVLLDLSTSPKMPHTFDVKYFSVVSMALTPEECDFYVDVRGL